MSNKELIDAICETIGCTQTYLAGRLGITKQYVSLWKTEKLIMKSHYKYALLWIIWHEEIDDYDKARLSNMVVDSMNDDPYRGKYKWN